MQNRYGIFFWYALRFISYKLLTTVGQQGSSIKAPSIGSTGVFGQSNTTKPTAPFGSGSIFGSTNTNVGAGGPTGSSSAPPFGNSIFGKTQQQPTTSFSNTTTNAPQSTVFGQNAASRTGNSNTQPLFSWSTVNNPTKPVDETNATIPSSLLLSSGISPNATVSNAQYGPAQPPSVEEQVQKILNAWNLNHPDCAFQRFFYNKVPVEQAALYVKPPNYNQQKWDEAVANRPSNSVVPVLAVGFPDVQKRINMQIQQVNTYRIRMREIVETLGRLSNKHDLDFSIKLAEAKNRHVRLSERILRLAIKVHVLRHRGYALKPNEEELRKKLDDLTKSLNNPEIFGRLNEIWARITLIFEGEKISEDQRSNLAKGVVDWRKNSDQLEVITDVLRDHQVGLSYVVKLMQEDLATLNKQLTEHVPQSQK